MITIKINTGNSAFEINPRYELYRILRGLAEDIADDRNPSKIKDINGNTIGTIEGLEDM